MQRIPEKLPWFLGFLALFGFYMIFYSQFLVHEISRENSGKAKKKSSRGENSAARDEEDFPVVLIKTCNIPSERIFNSDKVEKEPDLFNYNIHMFYYTWYRSLNHDGEWRTWNSFVAEHWNKNDDRFHTGFQLSPPEDLASNYYPLRGPYSSTDRKLIENQLEEIQHLGVSVISVSWFGDTSYSELRMIESILDLAEPLGIKVNFHIENYEDRSANNIWSGIKLLLQHFGSHAALDRIEKYGNRPIFYVRDSYLIKPDKWALMLSPEGQWTIRGSKFDSLIIGLYIDQLDRDSILESYFDGVYTLFGASGFTEGSSPMRWREISIWAKENNMLFIPTVAPGYKDTKIRPWNGHNVKGRKSGEYYSLMWKYAILSCADFISINSYNNWLDGTQIEPAIPKRIESSVAYPHIGKYSYDNYNPNLYNFYLRKTRKLVETTEEEKKKLDCVLGGF
eukprot:gb/GECH01014447.1/.p1 GENE.gb/GECH01014447.1/~~gb/GECH01014447.1/.p1  ORF type:complete len:451 (+),score=86.97 gb/GECH01014447.1/:1-1353(+)